MKKSFVLLIAIFSLSITCKKEGTKVTKFDVISATVDDIINYGSISYAIINFSDINDIKDTSDYKNPDVFSNSVKVEKPLKLTLKAEHTYLLKKFDLFDNSGNLLYYIPYRTQLYYTGGFTLPFPVKAMDGTLVLTVTRK